MNISGSHAVVTGGGRRIGNAIATSLLEAGARVTLTYRHSKAECEQLMTKYPNCACVQLDLAVLHSIENASRAIAGNFGSVQILINNASEFFPTPLSKTTEAEWDRLHSANVKGHFFFIQRMLSTFRSGAMINILDIHADLPLKNFSAYTSQKAAFKMLSRNLAVELAPSIRVNSVSPGTVLFPESFSEEQRTRHLNACPMKREGSPKDIAEAVKFLIQNDYVTGFDLKVDGGSSLACR